ncbi:hypothetical protein SCHPADRAFT_898491 [Schizopora paradoxa]|uniref:F-box domain-containing protein n=1 Tax=Schizopora paradoxa TaxID=27342 RepID=A0A0H2SE06_9AGAM|nr:hypothetical protein SCHPADRAFT_898491 [Schizopora paradoxa]
MRVCRQWHAIASSDPGLWSTFIVNIRQLESPIDDVSHLPTIFEQVLRRSQQNPLTLKLALSASPYLAGIDEDGLSHMINVFTKLAHMAVGHCERWRDVFICINPGSYFYNSFGDEGTLGLGGRGRWFGHWVSTWLRIIHWLHFAPEDR